MRSSWGGIQWRLHMIGKDIMEVALGPHHVDTIESCQNLSKAYGEMGSYVITMEFQQKVIDAWESHGASAEEELREAKRLLEQLKRKSRVASAKESPKKALPLPHTRAASRSSLPEISLHQSRKA